MRKEVLTCDKCLSQLVESRDFISISIDIQGSNRNRYYSSQSLEICKICAEKIGVVERVIKKEEIQYRTVEGIETRLYQVVKDLIDDIITSPDAGQ